MRLLETTGSLQNTIDGALINHFAVRGRNGALTGCIISSNGAVISISSGTLIIRGHRILFEEPEDLVPYSTVETLANGTYKVYFSLTETGSHCLIEKIITTERVLNEAPIERATGVYDYLVCTFTVNGGAITELISFVEALEP